MSQPSAQVYPCLFYRDPFAAIEWLVSVLGFEKHLIVPGPNGTLAHSELRLGQAFIMVGHARPERGLASPLDLSAVNQHLCFYLDDVEAHYAQAAAGGAEILQAPYDTDHNSRDYSMKDLEGNIWHFGNYRCQ
jgi:uncharacterized glyoxalase superfamily protein PhnB